MLCVECHSETPAIPCVGCGGEPRVGGRYALHERIPSPTTSAVFRAVDIRTGDPVSIQEVLLGGRDPARCLNLARQEASQLRPLHHPGLSRWRDELVIGVGRSAALYLVEDHLPGATLAELGATGPCDEALVWKMMIDVLGILDYMHHGVPPVVHRAIGPDTVRRSAAGSWSIGFFGAVQDALQRELGSGGTIRPGLRAPEQHFGHAVPATDLYALGMTSLALFTGLPPAQLVNRVGQVDWRRLAGLSPGAQRLLTGLLQPDPADRLPTAAAVRQQVAALLLGTDSAHADADPGPTLVPAPVPVFDDTTGLLVDLLDEPTRALSGVAPPLGRRAMARLLALVAGVFGWGKGTRPAWSPRALEGG